MLNIGIIGYGFVGEVVVRWIKEFNKNINIYISDPAKGYDDDLSSSVVYFISIHIPTEDDGTQDLTNLRNIIKNLPNNKPIFIRTTVLPGTCDALSKEFNKRIFFMPEFLTERKAYADFCEHTLVFTGEHELLQRIFINKNFITMNSLEAELAKYAHNVFGALKVTYFNCIHELSLKMNMNYNHILACILLSNNINTIHTQVPGPDGKFGYGGKCFPKDVNAFTELYKDSSLYKILGPLKELNIHFRGNEI